MTWNNKRINLEIITLCAAGGLEACRFTFDSVVDQFLPGTYDPPAFALKLAHKDVGLANALAPAADGTKAG
jgi:3-hydroxyisobutyrate dehydrogenase